MLRHYKTKEQFVKEKSIITSEDICFIKDSKEIYTHGQTYVCRDTTYDFMMGYNTVTSLSNLPTDKHLILAEIVNPGELGFLDNVTIGSEYRLILIPKSNFTIDFPNNTKFIPLGKSSATLKKDRNILVIDFTKITSDSFIYSLMIKEDSSQLYYQDKLFINMKENEVSESTISEIFPDISGLSELELQVWTIGKGGEGGNLGDGWGLYHGGSGSPGANGSVLVCRFKVNLSDIITYKRLPDGYEFLCNGIYMKSPNGVNGNPGGDASAGGRGDGGLPVKGIPNIFKNTSKEKLVVTTVLDYYDKETPSGITGGAGDKKGDVYPNPLPEDVQYVQYARAAYGMSGGIDNANNVPEQGGVVLRIYYK